MIVPQKVLIVLLSLMPGFIKAAEYIHELNTFIYAGQLDFRSKASPYFSLSINDTCSILTYEFFVDSTYQELLIAENNACIVDMTTGTRYTITKALHGAQIGVVNVVKNQKGKHLLFQLSFPRLPKAVQSVNIYGIPAAALIGGETYDIADLTPLHMYDDNDYPELFNAPLLSYSDNKPSLATPLCVHSGVPYNQFDESTFLIYKCVPKVFPVRSEEYATHRIAMWCTDSATYVTLLLECTCSRTLFYIPSNLSIELLDKSDSIAESYIDEHNIVSKGGIMELPIETQTVKIKMLPTQIYPLDRLFFIEGQPGDFVAIMLTFPTLPLRVNHIRLLFNNTFMHSVHPDINGCSESIVNEGYIGNLRRNRQYIKGFF